MLEHIILHPTCLSCTWLVGLCLYGDGAIVLSRIADKPSQHKTRVPVPALSL